MSNRFFVLILIAMILCSCGIGKRNSVKNEQVLVQINAAMDNIILNTLYSMNIKASDVQKVVVDKEINYSIPLNELSDLVKADRMIQDFIKNTEIRPLATILNNNFVVKKSYLTPIESQVFVVELYLRQARSSNLQNVVLPSTTVSNRPLLSIIIDDFGGFDGPLLDAFCELDRSVTFAILPGLPFSEIAMQKAIRSGREVIVHMPMEAENQNANPGRNAIYSHMSSRAIYDRTREYFSELYMAVGANQHMGSKISQDRYLMRASLRFLAERNLFFIDSRTTPNTVAIEIANELGIPSARRDLFLDAPENSDEVLYERLRDLQRLKDTQNRALVITHCFDRDRLRRLQIFIEEAQNMGFVLVPTSQYVQRSVISQSEIGTTASYRLRMGESSIDI